MSFDDPRLQAALDEGLAHYGESLWSEPSRMRAVLSDVLGGNSKEFRIELDALTAACEAGAPAALISTGDSAQAITNLVGRGMDPSAARGAVQVWLRSLGAAGFEAPTVQPEPTWAPPFTPPAPPVVPKPSGPGGFTPIHGDLAATQMGPPLHQEPTQAFPQAPSPPPPGQWSAQGQFTPPVPASGGSGRVVLISAAAIVMVLGLAIGGYFLTRDGPNTVTTAGSSTTDARTTTSSPRRTTTSVTTAPTTDAPTTAAPGVSVPPPSAAVVQERFGSLMSGACSPTEEKSFAFLACDYPSVSDARVYFEAWESVELAAYSIQHPVEPTAVHYQGQWPVDASERKGLYVSYINSTGDECREWSYEATQFEIQVCTSNASDADAITADLQR